jgi:hypothetical protein
MLFLKHGPLCQNSLIVGQLAEMMRKKMLFNCILVFSPEKVKARTTFFLSRQLRWNRKKEAVMWPLFQRLTAPQ